MNTACAMAGMVLAVSVSSACAQTSTGTGEAPARYPGPAWLQYAVPEEGGWSSEQLAEARAYADSVGSDVGMLIDNGVVVTSWGRIDYHSGIASVSKALQGSECAERSLRGGDRAQLPGGVRGGSGGPARVPGLRSRERHVRRESGPVGIAARADPSLRERHGAGRAALSA